ncbi:MAG: hypothetical protein DLM69_10470, partial [Candidatus Chloroheliales bacterium]
PSAYAPPPPGFTIRERLADYNQLSARWGEGVTVTGGQGWLVRGMQNGAGAAVTILRDGTEVEVNSFYIGADELLSIANSLAPLPGGHAPLALPAPFTLAEIRAQLPIAVFIPTDLPAGLVAEPPTVFPQSFPGMGDFATAKYMVVTIIYHTSSGSIALMVRNGMADIGYSDPTHLDHPVLANGISADFINLPTSEGGPLLQWAQEGSHIAISGPQQTRDSLLRIAASMSKSAELGATELPATRPTPTPAQPAFTLLHPAWLPEQNMSVSEWPDPGSPQPGANIVLSFDTPATLGQPHIPLTLREIKRGVYAEGLPDPQATRERVNGQNLFITQLGADCVRITWTRNDVDLTLTNAYDVQARPRYSCTQMERVAGSVR